MSTIKSTSKKRKRDLISQEIVFKLSEAPAESIGPLLVSYPALQAPSETIFKCYKQKKAKTRGKNEGSELRNIEGPEMLVVGESDNIEFISNAEETRKFADAGCKYLIAVHNRRTSTLDILPTPKSPYILTRTVKALKSIPPAPAPTAIQYREAKTALGETFGTKKAKANIRAQERNRVDVGAMEGVVDFLMEGIDKGATGLMTQDEAKVAADNNRLIPPFDSITTDPEGIYPLHNIIPETEWKALSVSAFKQAGSDEERIGLLPFKWSKWINSHLNETKDETAKSRKKNLKILLYISSMFLLRLLLSKNREITDRDQISEKMANVPGIVIDGLIARFTEAPRDSTRHVSTPTTQTKLLTYAFALCLRVDSFAANTALLAQDLSMGKPQVEQLFKTLGCKISAMGEKDRARLGLPDSESKTKRAVLNAPVNFPKPRIPKKKT